MKCKRHISTLRNKDTKIRFGPLLPYQCILTTLSPSHTHTHAVCEFVSLRLTFASHWCCTLSWGGCVGGGWSSAGCWYVCHKEKFHLWAPTASSSADWKMSKAPPLLSEWHDTGHVTNTVTNTHPQRRKSNRRFMRISIDLCCVCLLTPACFTLMWMSSEASSKFSLKPFFRETER